MKKPLFVLLLLLSTSAFAQQTDLQLVKTGPAQAAAGGDVTYTVTVTNLSAVDASPVDVTDTIPPGMTFQTARPDDDFGCSLDAGVVVCSGPGIPAGGTATFEFVFNIPAGTPPGTTFTNSAMVETETPDSDPENDTDSVQTTVVAPTDLAVAKSGPSEAAAGSDVTYTVTVTNVSGAVATAIELTDEIPEGMTFVSATPAPGFSCSTVEDIVCTAPSLAPGATATFTFVFNIDPETAPGTAFTNTATATTETPDANPENNTGITTTTVPEPVADVAVTKSGPTSAGPDTDVVYTITVSNVSANAATTVTLNDTLPGTMTFVSLGQSGAPFSCSTPAAGAGGTITCTAAALPAGESTTFTLTTHVPPGTPSGTVFQNTATITAENDPNEENNVGGTSLTVSRVDVSVTKSGPAAVTAGSNAAYTLTLANAGPEAAVDITLEDPIPAGTTFVSITHVSGVQGTCTASATLVTCNFEAFLINATSQYTLVLRAGDITSISNTATVRTASFDTDPSDNSSTANTTVTPSADLAVTKSGPASAAAGTNATYTVTLTNNGTSTATNVTLTDTLPAGTAFVSVTQTGGPTFTCGQAAGVVTCTRATLAPLATATFQVVAAIAPDAAGTITNTAAVTATTPDPAAGNNIATAPTNVTASADLAVTKSGPAAPTAGTNATYTVTVTNNGPSTAANVTLTDTLPTGTTFVSATQTSGSAFTCSQAAGVVTCTRATFAPLATASFDIVVSIPSGATGTLTNAAAVTATTPDPVAANNTATASTGAGASADLAVVKNGPATATAGTNATYTIALANNGPSTATNVTLTDTLPANTTFVSIAQTAGPAFACAHAAGVVTCTAASLPPLTPATFELVVAIGSGATGTLVNTAAVTATTPDPAAGNNTATASTNVGVSADLAVAKSGPAAATAGTNVTYTVTLTNNGPSTATGVTLTDTLPAGTTLVSATQTGGPAFTCGGTVTCTRATLAPLAPATFEITVAIPVTASGTIVNTAEVSATSPDPASGNNRSTATTAVGVAPADLSIAKTANAPELFAGATAIFTILVSNAGPGSAENVVVTDVLPAGSTLQSAPGCTGTTTVTCNAGTLAAGSSTTFTLTVRLPSTPGPVVNTATVTSTTPDPTPNNNAGTATINAVAVPAGIPTLSTWAMVLLALGLAMIVLLRR